jgi:hypothetical protein
VSLRNMDISGPYVPVAYRAQLCRELRRCVARIEGEVIERYCKVCDDWWPSDTEFFNSTGGGLHYMCRACFAEWRSIRLAAKPDMKSTFKIIKPKKRLRVLKTEEIHSIHKDAKSPLLKAMALEQLRKTA